MSVCTGSSEEGHLPRVNPKAGFWEGEELGAWGL